MIQDSIHRLVERSLDFGIKDGSVSLVARIAAVHVVFREYSECIYWFGQLTSHNPGILQGIFQSVGKAADTMVRTVVTSVFESQFYTHYDRSFCQSTVYARYQNCLFLHTLPL